MKKISVSFLVLIAMLTLVINFSGCKNLSQDVLQANRHLTHANKLYGKENFKGAVVEYEEALKKNPDLKKLKLQLYIASCYSSLYKANIQPPEDQDLLKMIRENASVLYEMKKALPAPAEEPKEGEEVKDPVQELKNTIIANLGNSDGETVINDFINNEENGVSSLKSLADKFIAKEKEIHKLTHSYSPIDPEYRNKIEENVFSQKKIKELNEYIDSNADAEDLETKTGERDSLEAKIAANNQLIEEKYIKNKDFYTKRNANLELKKEIETGDAYFKNIPASDIPVEKDKHDAVIKYDGMYDYIGKKLTENKGLEIKNREMKEYFSKKDDLENKKAELEAKNQALTAMEDYETVNGLVEKVNANAKEITRLKEETIELTEKKDDAEGYLITEYSEKYDTFSEKLFEDIDNKKELASNLEFLKAVKGYDAAFEKLNADEKYAKLNADIKAEREIISKNDKFLDTVKNLEEVKLKVTENEKYQKLLTESEGFLANVKNLDQIVERFRANEKLEQELAEEVKKAGADQKVDVAATLVRFGTFEYDHIDLSGKGDTKKKKIVLSDRGKELEKEIAANRKYFKTIRNYNKIIENHSQQDNYKRTVKESGEFLAKVDKLDTIKAKVAENDASNAKIDELVNQKKKIAKTYLNKLKNSKNVIAKFNKIIDIEDQLLMNEMFYAVSEGFSEFKTKFDEMIGFQNKMDLNGTTEETLRKEITESEKAIEDNDKYKELSKLINERTNLEYKIKSNKEFISMVEKKYKKGEVESKFDKIVVEYDADMKTIKSNTAKLDALNEKYAGILDKYSRQEAKVKEELANRNYFEKATKNEVYKRHALKNLNDFIADDSNSDEDKKTALNLLADMYKKIAQASLPEDTTTKELFYTKTMACYEELLKDAGKDKSLAARAHYSKAKLYSEFGKEDLAKQEYIKRIKLDPYSAEGYYYLANYLQERAQYADAIENHKKRIYALIDKVNGNHEIMDAVVAIDNMQEDLKKVKNLELYVERTAKYVKSFDDNMKKEFQAKKAELEDIKAREKENVANFKTKLKESYAAFKAKDPKDIDEKLRLEMAKAFYTTGVVYWTSSYRTSREEMHTSFRQSIIDSAFSVLDESIRLDSNYPEPWSYKALLWVEMRKKVDPSKRDEYTAKNQEANKVFVRLIKKRADAKRFEEAQKKI